MANEGITCSFLSQVWCSVCSFSFSTQRKVCVMQRSSRFLHPQITMWEVKWGHGTCVCPLQKHEIRLVTLSAPLQYASSLSDGRKGRVLHSSADSIVPSLHSFSNLPAFSECRFRTVVAYVSPFRANGNLMWSVSQWSLQVDQCIHQICIVHTWISFTKSCGEVRTQTWMVFSNMPEKLLFIPLF